MSKCASVVGSQGPHHGGRKLQIRNGGQARKHAVGIGWNWRYQYELMISKTRICKYICMFIFTCLYMYVCIYMHTFPSSVH